MDCVTFHHDSVLSDVHVLQPRSRHLMTRLNGAGQPVFLSRFRLLPQFDTEDADIREDNVSGRAPKDTECRGDPVSGWSPEGPDCRGDKAFAQSPEVTNNRGDRVSGRSPQDSDSREDGVGGRPPEGVDSRRSPEGVDSGQSPEGVDSGRSPEGVGSGQSPEGVGSGRSPEGVGSGRSPEGVGSGQSPGGVGSGRSPGGVGSGQSPEGVGSRRSPEGVDSGQSSDEDRGVVLDQDGDFVLTCRRYELEMKSDDCKAVHRAQGSTEHLMGRKKRSSESLRDEVCPVLLSMMSTRDPDEEDTSQSANTVLIEHTMATLLDDVGKQVWRGAMLLSDWLLSDPGAFSETTVLELGAGTGLTSIVASSVARRVYCTDVGEDLLSMCRRNICLNSHLTQAKGGEVRVRQLDWLERDLCTDPELEFSWTEEEVADLYDHTTRIIAADVVYDDDITDAFFRTLYQLCTSFNHSCDVYIAIEKRMNFTLRHLEVTCEAYEHFLLCLQQLQDLKGPPAFGVHRVAPDFPQSLEYERVEQLELWKVSASYPNDP